MFQLILPFQLELPLDQPTAPRGQAAARLAGEALRELGVDGATALGQSALALCSPASDGGAAREPKRRRRRVRAAAQEP